MASIGCYWICDITLFLSSKIQIGVFISYFLMVSTSFLRKICNIMFLNIIVFPLISLDAGDYCENVDAAIVS